MASSYEEKQYYRQKDLNSQRGLHADDDRRSTNRQCKRSKLICDNKGFDPILDDEEMDIDILAGIHPEIKPAIGTSFSSVTVVEATEQGLNLANWIGINEAIKVTPIDQCYVNLGGMKNQCRPAIPMADLTIVDDLKRAFHSPPTCVLSEIIRICHFLPYWIRDGYGALVEPARFFMTSNRINEDQLEQISRINQQITLRASYGVLFLQGTKFFAKTAPNRHNRRSAIKGYPVLKPDGELEHPWETAVRMAAKQIQYWNDEREEWEAFDLDEQVKKNTLENYLECLVTNVKYSQSVRYIGLFVIRLKPDVRIGVFGSNEVEEHGSWYSIEENVNNTTFYSICPFLKYIHEH